MNNISSKWFSVDCDPNDAEARQKRIEFVKGATILDLLGQIIKAEMERLSRTPESEYTSPSWAYKEADRNGQYRAYQAIYALTKRN